MTRPRLITAAGLADASGRAAAPGAILYEPGPTPRVLAAGAPDAVASHPGSAHAERVSLPGAVLIPAMVNAHTHLDLTSIGPRPFDADAGFAGWLGMVRRCRASDPQDIHTAVRLGASRSTAGGVIAVGDIAGSIHAVDALRASPLTGVSFLELFGLTDGVARHESTIARIRDMDDEVGGGRVPSLLREGQGRVGSERSERPPARPGLQPHAPYSAGMGLYRASIASGLPIATHLAESHAERELLTGARGPIRDLLASLGLWTPEVERSFGHARSSVAHLAEMLAAAPMLLAHVNDADDADIELLAGTGCSVVYCPRAHEYFGHHRELGPHRYRDMLAAGINVALGTDSVINIPEHESHRLSTLDEMRLLWRRDGGGAITPKLLLRMATANGARALGLDASLFDLASGPVAGIAAVDVSETDPARVPLVRVLESRAGVQLVTMDDEARGRA